MDLIWWLIGLGGVGGAIFLIAGFILGWPVLASFFIGTRTGRILLGVLTLIVLIIGVDLRAKRAGRAAERARLKRITAKQVADAAKERRRIDALSDVKVDKELARWDRK